jgi:flavin reductase (DIM6/NTAB) family NADH-FMN oxidoreductase RutF
VKGNTTKDTLHNVEKTGEVVINIVNYKIARQMALASIEYPPGVSEFEKSGLTPIPSELVKPYRVMEAPVQFECKVKQILPLGDEGGAGNLIICEVLLIHMQEYIFDEQGKIDPQRTDQVARMGRAFYCRAHGVNIFSMFQPVNVLGIGFDNLPDAVKHSEVLNETDLAHLASVENLPSEEEVRLKARDGAVREILHRFCDDDKMCVKKLHSYAKELIKEGDLMEAWKVILQKLY